MDDVHAVPVAPTDAPAARNRLLSALRGVNELWEAEEALVAHRAVKRSAAKQAAPLDKVLIRACSACRKVKAKCIAAEVAEGEAASPSWCTRCVETGQACVYPEPRTRGPKKRLSKNQRILQDIKRNLEAVLAGHSLQDNADEESDEELVVVKDNEAAEGLSEGDTSIFRNPLAFLADTAVGSSAGGSPKQSTPSHSYYDAGLYCARPERDFASDPVALGLLTASDLKRLVTTYFTHLYPFFWTLLPDLHTPDWLRLNSPFLTSVIAYIVSTYDPTAAHLTEQLKTHALSLAVQSFGQGLKSIEVVQAFFALSHWTSFECNAADNRAWTWLFEAVRMATELRLDVLVEGAELDSYRWALPPDQTQLELLAENRKRTWNMLFCGRLAMSVQSGRFDCIGPPPIPSAAHLVSTSLSVDHSDYHYAANLQVNMIFARALALAGGLREENDGEGLRASFRAAWKPEIDAWRLRWSEVNPFIDVHAENIVIMLNLVSLRFRGGSPDSVLAACKAAAIRTVQRVIVWEDRVTQLQYSSNYVISHIAYGAIFLLELNKRFKQPHSPELQGYCLRIVTVLEQIARNRPNAMSLATVYARRLARLCASLEHDEAPMSEQAATAASDATPYPTAPTFWSTVAPPHEVQGPSSASLWQAGIDLLNPSAPPPAPCPPPAAHGDSSVLPMGFSWGFGAGAVDFLDLSMADPGMGWLWSGVPDSVVQQM
ncbi:uncharacterized protein JCM10292_005430 [Rhodotorula paludigena]|uniref:uncharacterized protein n=1 Tax=Rhodotorula paludigena TaxID=86838 RepID=UPI00317941E6